MGNLENNFVYCNFSIAIMNTDYIQLYNYTTIQLYNYTTIQNIQNIQLYRYLTIQLCTTIHLYNYITTQILQYFLLIRIFRINRLCVLFIPPPPPITLTLPGMNNKTEIYPINQSLCQNIIVKNVRGMQA